MKLTNATGTSGLTCPCDSWLSHWERYTGRRASMCMEVRCTNRDLVGAHVYRTDNYGAGLQICPLCNAHNQSPYQVEVPDDTPLAPANRRDNCG